MPNLALYAGVGAAAVLIATQNKEAENCGIVGIVSDSGDASEFLLEGLTILQNRGYDSAGMATMNNSKPGSITCTKFASVSGTADSIGLLRNSESQHKGNTQGIAHTRWATHGGKTDANSHPHFDMRGQIAVVHNGTISNYSEIKAQLAEEGVTFKSQTDTEVIAQLIGHLMAQTGCSTLDAVQQATSVLEGTWGLCVMNKDKPSEVIVARNGSPLVVGYGGNCCYIASETSAFSRHTKRFISLNDGEIAVVKPDGANLNPHTDEEAGVTEHNQALMRFPTCRLENAPDVKIRLSPEPYPHWTIREIFEQPKSIAASLGYGGRISDDMVYLGGLDERKEEFLKIDHLLLAACGTSLNAGMYGARLMRELGSFKTIRTLDAGEARPCDMPPEAGGLLVVSQSGETKDVHRVLQMAESMPYDLPMFSVVNSVGSLIARTTRCGVYTHAGRENAVASTKAFVTQVTVMGLIAAWFGQHRDNVNMAHTNKMFDMIQSMHRLPITFGMALRTRAKCKEIAEKLDKSEHLFVLGKGYAEPIAHEGALKIKEITYLHAEGYSGGALKHGPFALIEDEEGKFGRTPIILVVLDDEHGALMKTAAEEVRARGAYTIVITDNPSMCRGIADDIVTIPNNGPLTALLAVLPLQLIAYELALLRGINPDVPRNLAKAVTVD
jgi:glucosamine--fructose-6-phosphate aminotransferase (isomerizing)